MAGRGVGQRSAHGRLSCHRLAGAGASPPIWQSPPVLAPRIRQARVAGSDALMQNLQPQRWALPLGQGRQWLRPGLGIVGGVGSVPHSGLGESAVILQQLGSFRGS